MIHGEWKSWNFLNYPGEHFWSNPRLWITAHPLFHAYVRIFEKQIGQKIVVAYFFFFLPLTYFTLTQYASDSVWRILRRIFVLWCNRNVFEVLACFMLLSLTCLSLFHLKGVPRWSRADTTGLKYFWRSILTRYDMIRYGMIWYDTIQHDMIR